MRVALITALCCLSLAWAADAQALTGAAAIAALNAQRAANGIPGDLVERTDWTSACAAHNHYENRNEIFDTSEDRARRGYSAQGDWAAHNAALARDVWTASHNPWQNTPLALMALLSPRLTQLGASASYQHVCATTFPGYLRQDPASPSLYPYPGDGATAVPFATWSFGSPFTPGDFVGLPAGYTTGPNLLVMADVGGQATVRAASLVGPDGPVELRTVDNAEDRIGALMPTGAILIPAKPLAPGATYRAAVTLGVGGRTLTRAWSFSTAPADPHTILFVSSALSFDPSTKPPRMIQGSIGVRTSSSAPVHISIVANGQPTATQDLADGQTWIPPQTPGAFSVCAHQEPTATYRGYDGCRPLTIRDRASFSHPTLITLKAAFAGRNLRYKIAVHPPRKREVTLSARRLVHGHWHTFRTVVRDANRTLTRTITARDSDKVVQVVVTIPQVTVGPETYRAARLVKTIRRP